MASSGCFVMTRGMPILFRCVFVLCRSLGGHGLSSHARWRHATPRVPPHPTRPLCMSAPGTLSRRCLSPSVAFVRFVVKSCDNRAVGRNRTCQPDVRAPPVTPPGVPRGEASGRALVEDGGKHNGRKIPTCFASLSQMVQDTCTIVVVTATRLWQFLPYDACQAPLSWGAWSCGHGEPVEERMAM